MITSVMSHMRLHGGNGAELLRLDDMIGSFQSEMHIGVNAQEALGYYRKIVAAITAAVKQSTQPHTPPTSTHAPAKKPKK